MLNAFLLGNIEMICEILIPVYVWKYKSYFKYIKCSITNYKTWEQFLLIIYRSRKTYNFINMRLFVFAKKQFLVNTLNKKWGNNVQNISTTAKKDTLHHNCNNQIFKCDEIYFCFLLFYECNLRLRKIKLVLTCQ